MTTPAPEYKNTPKGWAERWKAELDAANKATEAFRKEGVEAVRHFRDEREHASTETPERRWNLFYAGVSLTQALLYGQVPKVGVDRQHADSGDDVARVASEALQRILNAELDADDPYAAAIGNAFQDRLLPGLGTCRVRYEVEWEEHAYADGSDGVADAAQSSRVAPVDGAGGSGDLVPSRPDMDHELQETLSPGEQQQVAQERKRPGSERAEVEYVHWDDFRWSAGARTWHEVEWVAFKYLLSQQQLKDRFDTGEALKRRDGVKIASSVPLMARKDETTKDGDTKERSPSPWDRAIIWEVWDKTSRCVYWLAEGFDTALDKQEDPLELKAFFPCPRPMAANLTTERYLPRADWCLARDLYLQIDMAQTRLGLLLEAIRVAGLYDAGSASIKQLLSSAAQNELYPVDSWAAFAEKGGIKGQVDWLPLDQIAAAIVALEGRQDRLKNQLYEVTGHSDILRGQGDGPGVTATEQGLKAGFASARMRMLQKDLARFATELASLRAEVVCRFFDDASIIAEANMQQHPDQALLRDAIQMLRSPTRCYRVKVQPEDMADAEFAQMGRERQDAITDISAFAASMAPVAQQFPAITPLLLRLLQWRISTVRGASELESYLDQAITMAEQQPTQQPGQEGPDPKVQAQVLKGQQEQQKIGLELKADLIRTAAEVQADNQREANQRIQNVGEAQEKAQIAAQMRSMGGLGGGQ